MNNSILNNSVHSLIVKTVVFQAVKCRISMQFKYQNNSIASNSV